MGGAWSESAHQRDGSDASGGDPPGRRPRPAAVSPALALPDYDYRQLPRLGLFREAHPGVIIGLADFGAWEGRIPAADGETTAVRHTLRELLDRLDELMPAAVPDG